MTLPLDEPEILDGTRSWAYSQARFVGHVDPLRERYEIDCGWYDTEASEWIGAFCLVQADSIYEELIGDIVEVKYKAKKAYVYCIGSLPGLPQPIALSRSAFFWLELLDRSSIPVIVQATVPINA